MEIIFIEMVSEVLVAGDRRRSGDDLASIPGGGGGGGETETKTTCQATDCRAGSISDEVIFIEMVSEVLVAGDRRRGGDDPAYTQDVCRGPCPRGPCPTACYLFLNVCRVFAEGLARRKPGKHPGRMPWPLPRSP